ncbi:RING finger domain protein [Aspergillus bombycis]|uniref:RING finger domain protein n=1 Tax=Aspergillus bombycis TaxID=109264 RepID=A0A1F8A6X0_9EURO|nr:RING finger domain protein [Aspergillus bombycis]OGM47028.1 RING finger domain protein [Aspergillus bombycis]
MWHLHKATCLTSWFAGGRSNKTCPDCRAPVKTPPAPAYLVRAVVQLFTSRAELLEKGETTTEHTRHQREEAEKLENDKKNTHPKEGGLFRGTFNKKPPVAQPIVDLEDNVVRCPRCSWELEEDSNCAQCGYRHDEWDIPDTSDASDSTDSGSTVSIITDSEENSEMTDYMDDELEDGFGELDDFDWNGFQNGVPIQGMVDDLPRHLYSIIRHYHHHHPPPPHSHHPVFARNSHYDETSSTAHDTEESIDDYSDDTDMDSFIDDDEHIDQDQDSDSDRSTVVGGPETRHSSDQYEVQLSSEMTMALADDCTDDGLSSLDEIPDSEEDDEDDEDEDDEPIRPPVTGNRRRLFLASNGASNPPVLSRRAPRAPNVDPYAMRRQASRSQSTNTAGTSASNAITLDDDSDEGPVRPFRRNCRHAAR